METLLQGFLTIFIILAVSILPFVAIVASMANAKKIEHDEEN